MATKKTTPRRKKAPEPEMGHIGLEQVQHYADLLSMPKVQRSIHPNDPAYDEDDPGDVGTIVNVIGFTIPCMTPVTAAKLQRDITQALEPIIQRNTKRLRKFVREHTDKRQV